MMKTFKELRSQVNEEYYTGPTAYSGSDRTNVGDEGGADLGSYANGSRKTNGIKATNPVVDNLKQMVAGLNVEMSGTKFGANAVVSAITKARAKFNLTGMNFNIDAGGIHSAIAEGDRYVTSLMFGDRPLGGDSPVEDLIANGEIGNVEETPIEKQLPAVSLGFNFVPSGTGFRITAELV
tara:strand:- start:1914 stop:2453 length:540 start_codon:yes stop_codon:yes gene_type:complete